MNLKRTVFTAIVIMLLSITAHAYAVDLAVVMAFGENADSEIVSEFTHGLYKRDHTKIHSIVDKNRDSIPGTVDTLLDSALAPGLTKEQSEARYFVVERMATEYRKVTGDEKLLVKVKKRMFESRLSPATTPEKSVAPHIIKSVSTDKDRKVFMPNNIVIKSGETIRWVNNDTTDQLLSSVMTSIGKKGILSPRIEPGQSWERTFYTPGEYYYMSPINKVMYGKVVVVE